MTTCKHGTTIAITIRDTVKQQSDFNFAANLLNMRNRTITLCSDCARLLPSVRLAKASAINVDHYDEHEVFNWIGTVQMKTCALR